MRITSQFALAVTLILASASAQTPTGIVSLANLRGAARPLLIFAPSPDDPQLQIQLRRLDENPAAVAERNIVPIAIPYNSPSPTPAVFTPDAALAARHRFHVAPTDFTAILIGKDGGEKLRSSKPFSLSQLIDTIDAMPMRQDEMRSHPSH